jgi:hypothetical protein
MDLLQVPQHIRIILDYAQQVQAHQIGLKRVTEISGTADHPSRGNKSISFHEYIAECSEAVGAEIAVAQYFGIKNFTPTVNTFKSEADIGARIEVKWTKYRDGHLVIRASDRLKDVAVLVTGRGPVYDIAGWIPVVMARKAKYFHSQYLDHWVPQNNLFPIEDLKRSVYGSTEI